MASRGVHFAIAAEQAEALLAADGNDALMKLIEAIEEAWDKDNLAESDKAWDAMHRCLTDGQLEYGNGSYPLNHCVLGPRQLHAGDDYIVSLVSPEEVRDVAKALEFPGRQGAVSEGRQLRSRGCLHGRRVGEQQANNGLELTKPTRAMDLRSSTQGVRRTTEDWR